MSMSAQERREARALRWDGSVTAGNVLTAAAMIVGLIVWGIRLESRVDRANERMQIFEATTTAQRQQDRADNLEQLREVKASLTRIEQFLRERR